MEYENNVVQLLYYFHVLFEFALALAVGAAFFNPPLDADALAAGIAGGATIQLKVKLLKFIFDRLKIYHYLKYLLVLVLHPFHRYYHLKLMDFFLFDFLISMHDKLLNVYEILLDMLQVIPNLIPNKN